ncbi:MAG: N-acetyl-gamma-glutamyl-phosphate reductase [Streptosporangiaceae bacterium]
MGIRAAVAGASGYAGGELLRLLLDHPYVELGPVTAGSYAGDLVTSAHPHLLRLGERAFVPTEPDVLAEADVVFLAMPHGESEAIAAHLPSPTPVIDLGADHRLADADTWERFYGTPHAGRWAYGIPELPGGHHRIVREKRIANPGCYAAAVVLGLAPLLAAGLVEPTDVVVVAGSGTTGAGRSPRPQLLGSEVMGSLTAYKVGGAHQHTPEIEQALSEATDVPVTVSMTPVLVPMPRGILAACTARQRPGAKEEHLREALATAYAGEPFVRVLPEGAWPRTADTLGSNAAHIQVASDRHAGRAVVITAIDNLGKGAAGQAVQNANLILGLDETAGLTAQGIAP